MKTAKQWMDEFEPSMFVNAETFSLDEFTQSTEIEWDDYCGDASEIRKFIRAIQQDAIASVQLATQKSPATPKDELG
jgi:hypothetical protein